MNTSVQIKTHTNHSASIRNVENLRESEQFKNPHIEILKRTPNYKFEDIVSPVPRADVKSEKQRQSELRKVNNKINTYSKRLEVFKAQNNTKKIESLTKQIEELNLQKEHLKEIKSAPETRGKKRE
jgi:transcription initiation factor IIF auxiliary subunit